MTNETADLVVCFSLVDFKFISVIGWCLYHNENNGYTVLKLNTDTWSEMKILWEYYSRW